MSQATRATPFITDGADNDSSLSPEWVTEIDRRMKQIDQDEAVLIDADTAFARIRENLDSRRR